MTITEFVDYCRNMHNAAGDSHWSDAEIYKLCEASINEVLSIIGLIEDKDESITTVASTQAYSFPTDTVTIKRIYFDGEPLKQISFREWDARKIGGTDPEGTPREWVAWNDQIILVPTPDSAKTLTIYRHKKQSAITASGSTIDIPEILHDRLTNKVIGLMYAKDENKGMAQMFLSDWDNKDIPAFHEFKRLRTRTGRVLVNVDADSVLGTENGVV